MKFHKAYEAGRNGQPYNGNSGAESEAYYKGQQERSESMYGSYQDSQEGLRRFFDTIVPVVRPILKFVTVHIGYLAIGFVFHELVFYPIAREIFYYHWNSSPVPGVVAVACLTYLLFGGFQFLWARGLSFRDRKLLLYPFTLLLFVIEVLLPPLFIFVVLRYLFVKQPTLEGMFLYWDWTIYPILFMAGWTFYKLFRRFRFFNEDRVPMLAKWAYKLGRK